MNFNEYVEKARTTAIYDGQGEIDGLNYALTGLGGEVGEVFNVIQKMIRDDSWEITEAKREKLLGEFGGCFWFVSQSYKELQLQYDKIGIEYSCDIFEESVGELTNRSECVTEIVFKGEYLKAARRVMAQVYDEIGAIYTIFDEYEYAEEEGLSYSDKEKELAFDVISDSLEVAFTSLIGSLCLLDIDFQECLDANLELLSARKDAGTISGSGDGITDRGE